MTNPSPTRNDAAGQKVAYDLGCGEYKHKGAIGIDIIEYPTVDVVADIHDLRGVVPDSIADEVYMIHSLEHVNPLIVLKEAFRILKPGGTISIEVPNAHDAAVLIRLLLRNTYAVSPDHVQCFGIIELENVLRKVGFEIVEHNHKEYDSRFKVKAGPSKTHRLGRLVSKIFPQFSEAITMRAMKPDGEPEYRG